MATNNRMLSVYPINGTILVCPMCKEEFKVTDDTRFMRKGEYVCDWKCFMGEIKHHEKTNAKVNKKETTSKEHKNKNKKEVTPNPPILKDGVVDLFG